MDTLSYRQWRANYEALMAYGRSMGWVRGGPQRPRPPELDAPIQSRFQQMPKDHEIRRKLMGDE